MFSAWLKGNCFCTNLTWAYTQSFVVVVENPVQNTIGLYSKNFVDVVVENPV